MEQEKKEFICKHCGGKLTKLKLPMANDWGAEFLMVCFNDECDYYKRGWDHMSKNYNVNASYRYSVNSANGKEGPLAVFSPHTHKTMIVED